MQDISMGWHPPSMRPQPSPVGGYSFLWSLSAVTAAATFALCQLRGDSELQQLKLCIQGLFMVQVAVVGATLGAILGAIVAPLSLVIMRIASVRPVAAALAARCARRSTGGRSTAP